MVQRVANKQCKCGRHRRHALLAVCESILSCSAPSSLEGSQPRKEQSGRECVSAVRMCGVLEGSVAYIVDERLFLATEVERSFLKPTTAQSCGLIRTATLTLSLFDPSLSAVTSISDNGPVPHQQRARSILTNSISNRGHECTTHGIWDEFGRRVANCGSDRGAG